MRFGFNFGLLGWNAGGATISFLAAYYDGDQAYEMLGIVVGEGVCTTTHTATFLAPDDDGIYNEFGANKAVWAGGRFVDEDTVYATDSGGTLLSEIPNMVAQGAMVQSQDYSNDQSNVEWTSTNGAAVQDAIGIKGGANTACTLTASAANCTCVANAVTAASATHSTAWHLKRKTGTGTVELTVDGGTTWQDVTSLFDSTGFFRISADQATVTDPAIGIRIVTSGDAVYVGNAESHLNKSAAEV